MEKETKSNKKGIIITIVALIIVALVFIGVYFVYKYMEESRSIKQEWGQTYYNYIKATKEENVEDKKVKNNSKIGFVDIPEIQDPVMIVEYEKEEKQY